MRKRILSAYIEPILMYGCEAWIISKSLREEIEAVETWFLRKMLRVSWTERKTNESAMEQAQYNKALMNKIRKRQATFIRHVMRKKEIEHRVTTGKMEGKQGRGRPRMKNTTQLSGMESAAKQNRTPQTNKTPARMENHSHQCRHAWH